MIEMNKEQLLDIAQLGANYGVLVINFLTFNPYFEWQERIKIPFQGRHSLIAPYLKEAIDFCTANGIEANVRYMPLCQMIGYEQHVYNGYQLPYDPHEWDYNSWYDCKVEAPSRDWYKVASMKQKERHGYIQGEVCNHCGVKMICDGFHTQYVRQFGFKEAVPYPGQYVEDPTFFIKNQYKLQYNRFYIENRKNKDGEQGGD
jgi:hypothetical protein